MPAGSTVTHGGAAGDGTVSVNYGGIGGWAARDYLAFAPSGGDPASPSATWLWSTPTR